MKKLILLISLFISIGTSAQTYNGNINLLTQQDVDNFAINYPGINSINGTLIIGDQNGNCNITNVDSLQPLVSITSLRFFKTQIQNLTGFNNLTTCSIFQLWNNSALQSFSGFSNVTSLNMLIIEGSNNLVTINSFQNLQTLGNLFIGYCSLNSISLPGLNSLNDLFIDYCPNFSNLNGFTNLVSLNNLTIRGSSYNFNFSNYSFLNNIKSLSLESCPNQLSLSGIVFNPNMTNLNIGSCNNITNLNELSNVTKINNVSLGNLPNLNSLNGLNSLNQIPSNFVLYNTSLQNLNELNLLTSIGTINISHNTALNNINGLNHPITISGSVIIMDNTSLSNCSAQSICNYLGVNAANASIANNAIGCNSTGQVIIACNPVPLTKLVSTQCGQLIPDLSGSFYCVAVSGAQDYEWEITNTSLGYSFTKVRGLAVTSITKTDFLNLQFGQTYYVRVRAKVGGVWGNFGTTCSITLGNPVTQLQATDCGATFANLNGHFFANQLFGAQDYQWEFTNTALGYSFTKIRNQAVSSIPKTDITGLQFGQTYQVRVKAKVGGIWGSYGPSCSITLGAFPTTKLISSLCGATFNLSGWFYCDAISGAQDYEWEFTNTSLGYSNTLQRGLNVSSLGRPTVTGLLNGQTYNVRVRAKVGGVWGTFGNSCAFTINTSSPTRMANAETSNDIDDKDKPLEIIAFPNPFSTNLSITINGLYEFEQSKLEVYNSLGEKVYSSKPSENIFDIKANDWANGIYYISLINGEQKIYKKIVKQE